MGRTVGAGFGFSNERHASCNSRVIERRSSGMAGGILRSPAVAAAVLIGAVAVVYANSLSGAMVFDDISAIRENPTIRNLASVFNVLSPPTNSGLGGRPLANVSFALNYAISGTDARGYHGLNVMLHMGTALLLMGIVRRTLLRRPPEARLRARATGIAAAAALAWAIHPVTTASVTYLSQRTELLMGFCYAGTVYAFIRAEESNCRRWYLSSLVACTFGMLSKEVMASAPILVLLYDRTFLAGTFRAAWDRRRTFYAALAVTWIVLAIEMSTDLSRRSVGYGLGVSALEYALTQAVAILHYVKLAIWPAPLVFDYGPVYSRSIVASVIVIAALAATWIALRRHPVVGLLGAAFFLVLAPTSSIVPVAEQPIAENRLYLPLAVIVIGTVIGLASLFPRRGSVLTLPVCLALGWLTVERNGDYRTELGLWADTVAKRPENPRARYNYGVLLLDDGHANEALHHLATAARLRPAYPEGHNSLGNALLALGRVDEAIAAYRQAVTLRPDYARAWYNLGSAQFRQGELAAAASSFERTLRLAPDMAEAHNNLGNVYFQSGDAAGAVTHYEQALHLNPRLSEARYNAGSACLAAQQFERAVGHFSAATELIPTDAELRNAYGVALLRVGRMPEAAAQFREALRLRPEYEAARINLEVIAAPPEQRRGSGDGKH